MLRCWLYFTIKSKYAYIEIYKYNKKRTIGHQKAVHNMRKSHKSILHNSNHSMFSMVYNNNKIIACTCSCIILQTFTAYAGQL